MFILSQALAAQCLYCFCVMCAPAEFTVVSPGERFPERLLICHLRSCNSKSHFIKNQTCHHRLEATVHTCHLRQSLVLSDIDTTFSCRSKDFDRSWFSLIFSLSVQTKDFNMCVGYLAPQTWS